MPIQAQLHDGRILEFPDGTNPQVIQATVKKVLAQTPGAGARPPETTFLGQVGEAFKGLAPGAIGLVESAAIGASALLPEEQERAAREAIARVAGAAKAPFAPAPGYENSIIRKGSEAVGSTLPFLAAGPLGWAGRLGAMGLGVGAGAGEARTRAETEGATAEQRGTATALGTIPGALEIFAPFRILARIPEGEVLGAVSRVKRALVAGGEEAAQEAASGLAQNMIARGVYKPDQALIEGLGEQAAYGGATGAIIQGLMDLALGRRARGADAGAEGAAPIDVVRQEAAKKEAERAVKAAAAAPPPVPPTQAIIDETLNKPVSQAFAQLTQAIEELKQQPASPQRNAAIKELEAERGRREREDAERVQAGKKAAEGFLTAGQAATQAVTPREEFDPTQARRDEIERLRIERETLLVKGKPPAAKSPARRRFDELDARLVEIGGGRWTPPVEAPAATAPTAPTVEEPTTPAVGLTEQDIFDLGITKRQPIFKRLLGKEPTDGSVLDDIEDYLNKGHGSEESRTKLAEFKNRFAPKPPEAAAPAEPPPPAAPAEPPSEAAAPAEPTTPYGSTEFPAAPTPPEPPSATSIPTEQGPTGAGVSVAGGPPAVSTAQGTGAVEPVRVVPPVEDAGRPAAGEGQQPPAVTEAPAPRGRTARAESAEATEPIVRGEYEPPVKEGLKPERERQLRAKLAQQRKEIAVLEAARDKAEGNVYLAEITGNEEGKIRAIDAHEGARLVLKKAVSSADRTYAQLFDLGKAEFEGSIGEAYVAELRAERDARDKAAREKTDTTKWPYTLNTAEAVREDVEYELPHSAPEYKAYIEKFFTPSRQLRKGVKEEDAVREGQELLSQRTLYRTVPQSPVVTDRISDAELNKIVSDIEKALGGDLDITVLDDVTDIDNKEAPGSRAGGVIGGKVYLFRSGITDGIEGQKTIFHEVFHKGLRNLLPSAEYGALMTKLYNQSAAVRQAADAYLASEAGKKDTEKLSPEDSRVLAVNEALAEMAEGTDLNGSTLRQLGNFFARLADRFGMPTLARAIRTMGLNPLQAFIRDAIQAGIQPSTETTETQFRTVTPQTEAATAGVDVIGKESKKSFTDFLRKNPALAARIKSTDYLAGLDDVFTKAFAGKVRDALGNLNPMVLVSRALDHGRVSLEAMRIGGLKIKDGLVQAAELTVPEDSKEFPLIAGKTVSYQKDVIERLAKEAKKAGKPYEEYRTQVDTVLYAHREYNLREHNRRIEAQALALEAAGKQEQADQLRKDQIIELLIKDNAKLDELEAEFQRNKDIQEIGQVMDAVRFNNLDVLVQTNRLSPEKAQEYKDNIGYIPFKRIVKYEADFDAAKGGNRGIAALKNIRKLEGSDRQSLSVVENFADFMDWATREAMMNDASLSALKDMDLLKLARKGANNETGATGANIDVYDKGEKVTYYVPDPAHVIAFSFRPAELSSVFKGMQKASNILRAGVTAMPPFAIKQIFDDIVRAYTFSGVKHPMQLTARILTSFPANWYREAFGKTQNATVREMAKLGIFGTFDFTKAGNLRDILQEAGAEEKSLGRTIMRYMEAGAKASDISVRQAIYEQVLKETGDPAAAESRAREIINFSRRGSSGFMNTMIAVVPFFNAYARGMDKLAVAAAGKAVGQSTGQARAMFYKRMGVMTAMGLAYAFMMSDDDEYNALPDHVRDTNWVLPYGKELGFTPGIPVPAELAFFFKAIPERVVRYYKLQGTDEEKAAIEIVGNLLKRGVDVFSSPNVTPQILRPFVENISNYSWFLQRPLESQGQLALDPFQRFGTGTSEFAKVSAEALEEAYQQTGIELLRISPIKIENAIRGILGTTAGVALAMTDALINPTRTDRPLHQMLGAQLTGASAVMKDAVGTKYIDSIYDLEKDVNRVNATYNRLLEREPEKADEYLRSNIGLFSIRPAVSSLMKSIKGLNDEASLIDRTKEISAGERRMLINQLRVQQNEIAQQGEMLRTQARRTQQGL